MLRQNAWIAGLAALAACSSSTGPEGTGRLTVQLVGRAASATPALETTDDVLTITSVQVVARKIRLERTSDGCGSGEPPEGQSAECSDLRLDPMLLEPPLDGTTEATFTVDLPEGTYRSLMLQIHKPSNANEDAAFLADHPNFAGLSLRVVGSFNGEDFTFESALTAVVEIALDTPVEIEAETPAAVTLALDVAAWFAADAGGLLDPIDPTQQIRSRIEQNIRASFHAFRDHDGDGAPD
ncbi:MAG: hypothetical protein AB7R55_01955 [Gemmatimonadales bacterium]